MAEFAEDVVDVFADLGDALGFVGFTYADGGSTKDATTAAKVAYRKGLRRGRDGEHGLDPDSVTYVVTGSFFTSGFSGAAPGAPSAGHTITPTGEKAWTVDGVESVNGAIYVLRCSRRRQRGAQ